MRKRSLFIVPLFIVLILSGCVSNEPSHPASTENANHTAKPEQPAAKLPEKEKLDEFVKKIQPEGLQLNKIIHDDIDGDGKQEYIVTFGGYERILIARFDGEFQLLGEPKESIGIVHHYSDVEIMNLEPGKKFIVLHSVGGHMDQGSGFSIFQVNGNTIKEIISNFPNATGRGTRELKDYDADGIFESVSYHYLNDVQRHIVVSYTKYDGSGVEKQDLKYGNDNKRFVYPKQPQDVIKNFVENFYFKEWLTEELKQLVEDQTLIDFNMRNYVSFSGMEDYELDLDIKEISSDEESVKTFTVQSMYEKPTKPKLIFTLNKVSNQWKIKKVEQEPAIEQSQIWINGKKVDAKPILKGKNIYIPMQTTFPELGLNPQLNAEYQAFRVNTATSVVFFKADTEVVSKTDMNVDNFEADEIYKNRMRRFKEKAVWIKDYPIQVNDKVYISLSFMKSYLNVNVTIDKENNIILSSEKFDDEQNLQQLYAAWEEKFGKIGNSYSNTWYVYNYKDFYDEYYSWKFRNIPQNLSYALLYYKDAEISP
ncbi:stalk domain-containing protein [Paenibacillus elgii]|nr:stalk domain-containing protein [Paenibacillus elgii]